MKFTIRFGCKDCGRTVVKRPDDWECPLCGHDNSPAKPGGSGGQA